MSDLLSGSIPAEIRGRVEKILAAEPEHRLPEAAASGGPSTLRSLLQPFKPQLFLAFLLVLLASVAQNAGPLLIARAIDHGLLARDYSQVLVLSAAWLAATVATMILKYASSVYTGRLGQELMARLRVQVFSHLQSLSIDFYGEEKAGRIMASMISHIETLSSFLQEGLVSIAVHGVTLAVILCALFFLHAGLAAILLLAVLPIVLVSTAWFRKTAARAHLEVRHRIGDLLSDLRESLAGMRVVRAHGRREHHRTRHGDVIERHRLANNETVRISSKYTAFTEIAGLLGQGLIIVIGYRMVIQQSLSVGELVAFVLFLRRFFTPIQGLLAPYDSYLAGQSALIKIGEILAREPTVRERPDAVALPPLAGEIRLENVSFHYKPGKPVLEDIDLRIQPGETVAFVGPTGAGKSTLAKLLVRLQDPVAGRILIDGHDLRDVSLSSLRRQIGVVPQEPFLFHGTIRENIAFAKPDASAEEIEQASRAVGLDEVARRLQKGLDSPCHESGASLSSGQKQLIALARIFLIQPRILILDEATSRLDLQTEAGVEAALDRLLQGRTAILIAHRLTTVRRAHRIAFLDGQRIQELGSPEALLEQDGRFAAMLKAWEKNG